MQQKFTIFIADDHNIVAQGIAKILNNIPMVQTVLVFNNGSKLFDACLSTLPDLVFLDLDMPIWDGRKTLMALKEKFPTLRCLMLSMNNEKSIVDDCIDKGASGYLNKDCTEKELEEALLTSHPYYFSNEVLKILSGYNKPIDTKKYNLQEPLTERELEILALFCEGLSPKEIAEKIYLSPRTVETHKKNIMQKMDVNSIGKLISVALKNKLIN